MPVKSPCNGTCLLDPRSGYCMGCYRTGDEIGSWMTMSDGTKKRVISKTRQRRGELKNATTASCSD